MLHILYKNATISVGRHWNVRDVCVITNVPWQKIINFNQDGKISEYFDSYHQICKTFNTV